MKSKKVVIFSQWQKTDDEFYIQALKAVGLRTRLVPPQPFSCELKEKILDYDGILFAGGEDISPHIYAPDKQVHHSVKGINSLRDKMEMEALKTALCFKKPIFAVCRGLQLLNCLLGGTLYQDLDSEYPIKPLLEIHQQNSYKIPRETGIHPIIIKNNSLLHRILGRSIIKVNSTHHQAAAVTGRGLTMSAHSPQGVVEALELDNNEKVLAVQFHPEIMINTSKSFKKLFEYFAEVIG